MFFGDDDGNDIIPDCDVNDNNNCDTFKTFNNNNDKGDDNNYKYLDQTGNNFTFFFLPFSALPTMHSFYLHFFCCCIYTDVFYRLVFLLTSILVD